MFKYIVLLALTGCSYCFECTNCFCGFPTKEEKEAVYNGEISRKELWESYETTPRVR